MVSLWCNICPADIETLLSDPSLPHNAATIARTITIVIQNDGCRYPYDMINSCTVWYKPTQRIGNGRYTSSAFGYRQHDRFKEHAAPLIRHLQHGQCCPAAWSFSTALYPGSLAARLYGTLSLRMRLITATSDLLPGFAKAAKGIALVVER